MQKFGVGKWRQVQKHLGICRSPDNLRYKWRQLIQSSDIDELEAQYGPVKKGIPVQYWNCNESNDLYNTVQEIGVGKWTEIANVLGGHRSPVSIRDRWRHLVQSGSIRKSEKLFGAETKNSPMNCRPILHAGF